MQEIIRYNNKDVTKEHRGVLRMILGKKLTKTLTAVALAAVMAFTTAEAAVNAGSAIGMGIDVSKWQGAVNWAQVAASGVNFAFIKVGSSYSGIDPYFDYNMKAAQMCGIRTGVYIYSYATTPEEAAAEAAFVLAVLQNYSVTFPVAFDIEDNVHKSLTTAQQQQIVATFCSMIDAAGYHPMVYAGKNWYLNRLGDVPYDKWVAQYSTQCDYPGAICVWQASQTGSVPGVAGNVDIDYLYKDYFQQIVPEGFVNHYNYIRYYQNWKMQTGWINVGGLRYHMDALGHMQFGWFSDETGSYYLENDGHALVGQNKVGGVDFYFDEIGRLTTGWVTLGGYNFYYDPTTGAMVRGWLPTPGGTFFFDLTTGAMSIGAVEFGGNSYFFNASGLMQTGWVDINGQSFYYDPTTGAMVKGWVTTEKDGIYYTDLKLGNKLTGLQVIGDNTYYFDGAGRLQTGLVDIGGVKFFFDPAAGGAMVKNTFGTNGIGVSYFAEDGHMVTGLTTIGAAQYLFDAVGTLQVNTFLPTDNGTIVTDETGKVIFFG